MVSKNSLSIKRGFTIVELLVVIVVIGILAAITIVSYTGISSKATTASLQSDLTNSSKLLKLYQVEHSSYPTGFDANNCPLGATAPSPDTKYCIKPSSGTTYTYKSSATNPNIFCITTTKNNQSYNISPDSPILAGPCPVLSLDAGNKISYPGVGTTWTDLSGYDNNGTLNGGVSYSAVNGGVMGFDGVDDIISLGTGNTFFPLSNFSIELWFNSNGATPITGTTPGLLGLTYGIRLLVFSTNLQFGLNNTVTTNYLNSSGTHSFYNSSWHHVVIQANSTNMYMYIDGLLSNKLNAVWTGSTSWPTNAANIGRDNNDGYYFFTGKIALIKFYNSVLSDIEVQQNFSTMRARYGL